MTPAHVLVASASIWKSLSERLWPWCVETGAFEEYTSPPPPSTLPEAEYSLLLCEVDVLINSKIVDTSVLNSGSQIVAIHADLARELGARVNTRRQMEMEGADSNTSWMLRCAEKLMMRLGDVNFQVHTFIVETAPFRLLLGHPFHNLLLTKLEDHEDGSVSLSIRDPADQSRKVT